MSAINNISIGQSITPPVMPAISGQAGGPSFKDVLVDSIQQIQPRCLRPCKRLTLRSG
jgi:hypothetical protein